MTEMHWRLSGLIWRHWRRQQRPQRERSVGETSGRVHICIELCGWEWGETCLLDKMEFAVEG